jgi:hypothetical protein
MMICGAFQTGIHCIIIMHYRGESHIRTLNKLARMFLEQALGVSFFGNK